MSPLDLIAVLERLDRAGARIWHDNYGKIHIRVEGGVPDDMSTVVKANRALLVAVTVGRAGSVKAGSFHALAPCDRCGQVSMVRVGNDRLSGRTPWPACRMTPYCGQDETQAGQHTPGSAQQSGRHVPMAADIGRAERQTGGREQAKRVDGAGRDGLFDVDEGMKRAG